MTGTSTMRPSASLTGTTGAAIGVPALVAVGYLGIASPFAAAALAAAMALAVTGVVAFRRPRLALALACPILLLAGTKFRLREATATVDGVLDGQIALELVLFAVIACGVIGVWLATRQRLRLTAVEAVVAAYGGLAALSTFWSAAPALTAVRAAQLAVVTALAIVAVRVLAPSGAVWTTARALIPYVLICSAIALWSPWPAPAYYDEGVRFTWFATHPIAAGTLAAAGALALFSVLVNGRAGGAPARAGVVAALLTMALSAVLVMTGARGPMLAFAASVAVLCLMRLPRALRTPALVGAAALALAAFGFSGEVRSALASMADQDSAIGGLLFRGQSADDVFELNGRLALWQDLWPSMLARPLIGYGYQASRAVVLDAAPWAAYAHNGMLQTLLDLGVAGGLLVAGVLVTGLRAAFQRGRHRWASATVAALMVFLAINALSTESFAGAPGVETLILFVCVLCTGAAHAPAAGLVQVTT